ncbi:MAG: site-specific DNA-methyltransferase [Candidatus Accumulibacter sp.]|jgi:adenine-specific DNA-methyltransferase|nr:site-specific DNA-methyltransferase [Accumulibacter sp.]
MTNKHNPKFQELVAKLREIFQIDRPELDFGIYRILNARAGEINGYLENRLAEKVRAALSAGNAASATALQAELQEAEKNARALGVSPDAVPKAQELRARLKDATQGANEHENAVFSHLLTFFSRYYEQGDFISQRRYKGDTYAIPYAGEEVMLHWANKDQYYTKSGENFSNYSFKLEDGRTVHFRLVAADTAKDNRKDNDKERRFALVEKKTVTRIDEQGDEHGEDILPVEEVNGADGRKALIVRFDYAAQPKGTKQEALVTKAVDAVLADAAVKARWLALGNLAPTEKNPQRTLLEKHLTDYTAKNTADYFIHKDLGGFLRRELDFYIKNEVMHLDDVQNAGAFADIEKNLRMIQCLRAIALDLIAFLAQLEDFQKKLWLKKKFVVSSHYCITLDRVPEALWPEIVANDRQWAQWQQLGLREVSKSGEIDDLKQNPYLLIDTSLYSDSFGRRLLSALENLDVTSNGLLIHGDNFQGLRLLAEKARGRIQSVYIDPPYNTNASAIAYKNGFKDSSWLSLMESRLSAVRPMLTPKSVVCIAIDDVEAANLKLSVSRLFHAVLGVAAVRSNPSGRSTPKGFAEAHEYAIFAAAGEDASVGRLPRNEKQLARYSETDDRGHFEWVNFRKHGGIEATRRARPRMYYPIYASSEKVRLPQLEWNEQANAWNVLEKPRQGEQVIWPHSESGDELRWKWGKDSFLDEIEHFKARPDQAGKMGIYMKSRMSADGMLPVTWWDNKEYSATEYGTNLLTKMFGRIADFSFPKAVQLVMDCLRATNMSSKDTVIDFFAGSGTTAHAVIDMNRKDGGSRKYILIEQGEYFNNVTKPRVLKSAFSPEWRDGKPAKPNTLGASHCFKVLKLESYEDTLNNLRLNRTSAQGELLSTLPQQARDDYLLHYMLDVESRGSLLSVADFKKPFDYTLNVAVDSAGAFEPRKIDLVETFNYLIGLRVKHIDAQPERGFVTVTGTLPSGETCLVLWRDCDVLDYEGISNLCDKLAINPADNEFDVVYLNGDHNIPTVLTQTAEEGGATRVFKLRQIEPEFLDRMFNVEDI